MIILANGGGPKCQLGFFGDDVSGCFLNQLFPAFNVSLLTKKTMKIVQEYLPSTITMRFSFVVPIRSADLTWRSQFKIRAWRLWLTTMTRRYKCW